MIGVLFSLWFVSGAVVAIPGNITIRRIYVNEPSLYQRNGMEPKRIITANLTHFPSASHLDLRGKRHGFPMPPPPAAPQYAYAYAPAYQPPPPSVFIPPPVEQTPPPQPCVPKFPLPQCYLGSSGFMCCNNQLEQVMMRSFSELKNSKPNWSSANINQITTQVQRNAEHEFGMQFEVIVGVGDYASKSQFFSDKICKIYWECRYVLAYATPMPGVPYCTSGDCQSSQVSMGAPQGQCSGPPAPPPDNLPPPASYQSGPPPPASNSYAIAGAGTQPHYDLPQQPRPQPSVRIDTTAYDPQPLQEEPGQEGQEEDSQQPKIEVQSDADTHLNGPVPASPEYDPTASKAGNDQGYDPTKQKQKDDPNQQQEVGQENVGAEGATNENTTTSYGTQTAAPPADPDEVQSEVRRAEERVLYGPEASKREKLN